MRIDGKEVKRYVFARWSHLLNRPVVLEVEAFSKDHAVKRLDFHVPGFHREWECVHEELRPGETIGKLGIKLPLNPFALKAEIL